jgi:hypothetical protein
MPKPVIIFRVSNWFLDQINEYCKEERITYAELLNRAIVHLCRKYLGEDYAERKKRGRKNRV